MGEREGLVLLFSRNGPSAPKKYKVTQLTSRCPKERWENMEVKMVWTRPSSSKPTGEMVKCSVMNRVHLRELEAQVQAPNTWWRAGAGVGAVSILS